MGRREKGRNKCQQTVVTTHQNGREDLPQESEIYYLSYALQSVHVLVWYMWRIG